MQWTKEYAVAVVFAGLFIIWILQLLFGFAFPAPPGWLTGWTEWLVNAVVAVFAVRTMGPVAKALQTYVTGAAPKGSLAQSST